MKPKSLPLTEELDFSYLLSLMRPLHDIDEYAWLPELFTLIGHEKLIDLCRYAGGELVRVPTLDELADSIEGLQQFYNVYIAKKYEVSEVPSEFADLVGKIKEIYDARNS